MLAETRRLRIVELLRQRGSGAVSIAELSQLLTVSEMTIRRDLDILEEKSILRRVHGGAVAYAVEDIGKPFQDRAQQSSPEKEAIGHCAAQLVENGDRIILDAGTTTFEIAHHLANKSRLTVITNNIPVVEELSRYPHINTILLGGILKHKELCTIGMMVTQALSVLTADKVFLSANGVSIRMGATDPDMAEAEVKRAMIRSAREVILTADSTKYGQVALFQVASLSEIHKFVTDDAIRDEAIQELETEGVQVINLRRQMPAGIMARPESPDPN